MATTVTLDSDLLEEVMEETKASAVRKALEEWLRERRIQELRAMLGTIQMQFTNEEIEALEDELCSFS
ncbi:MAG: type II toxin-antitoxin system VapB family antitoxin [Armatimonadetes bacterium]|nr:type II toxin-antitoxin system VapB family antitoxin [Armatimonadota bacterium]